MVEKIEKKKRKKTEKKNIFPQVIQTNNLKHTTFRGPLFFPSSFFSLIFSPLNLLLKNELLKKIVHM